MSVKFWHVYPTSLNQRFILFLISIMGILSISFLLIFVYFYNAQLTDERSSASQAVSMLLKSSLERAMLQRDLPGLRAIVHDLGQQAEIQDVMILHPKGEIRFSADEKKLGQSGQAIIQSFCPNCQAKDLLTATDTRFLVDQQSGQEILRSFQPVANKPQCMGCHGSATEHPVNGILVVDYKAQPLRQKSWLTVFVLGISGTIALVFSALASWWFMLRFVLKPVASLNNASQSIAAGKLNTQVRLNGQDEMAQLAKSFNKMANHLEQSHTALKNREQFLQGLLDALPDGVRVIDANYCIIAANQTYAQQSGYASIQALLQQPCYKVTYQRDTPCQSTARTCPMQCLTPEQPTVKFMEILQRADGSALSTEVYAAQLTLNVGKSQRLLVEAVRDLEQAVHYSHEQKMSALGELAAGVAHEIHNPLASVRIALQASDQLLNAESSKANVEELRSYLQLVDERVEQCLDITHRLLKLGSLASAYPELVDVNQVIQETISLLRFEQQQLHIQEQVQLSAEPVRILAADNDLRMIVLNLVQNAFHAMPHGGVLSIQTYKQAGLIVIRIGDTGVGIPDEVLAHIFDPFFSRRPGNQRGMGLGLTITHTLVTQHQGRIEVERRLSGGTVFSVMFFDADDERSTV